MEDYFNCENKQEMQNIISEENQILKFIDCLNLNSLIIYYFLFEKFIPYIFVFILNHRIYSDSHQDQIS